MKKKRVVKFVVCILLALAVFTSAYVYVTNYKNSLVIRCNHNEITDGIYKMYMITEAAQMDRTQYESDQAFLEELERLVLDRICIDTYYATMCVQEDYTLTGTEKYAAEIQALSGITQLGFDNTQYEEESFVEFFDVSKEEIIEFYTRKALYNKYFLAMSGQTQDVFNDLMSEYQKFTERQKAEQKIQSYWENISVLNTNVSKYFHEHRTDYATSYIDVIFMRYPLDENGQVTDQVKERYAQIADRAYSDLHAGGGDKGGLYIHQFKETPPYNAYVTNAGKMYIDGSNIMLDEWGEEFVTACLTGQTNRTYRVFAEKGVIVFKVLSVEGEEGYWDEMALTIKTKEIGNKVRKAILQEEYEPVILNEKLYEELQMPTGDFWQNLLEKS